MLAQFGHATLERHQGQADSVDLAIRPPARYLPARGNRAHHRRRDLLDPVPARLLPAPGPATSTVSAPAARWQARWPCEEASWMRAKAPSWEPG
jgi:hypothetical protein